MTASKRAPGSEPSTGTKGARTRRRIMDAAARVVGRRGFAGTRLSEVASEAGLQGAAIYYHFPTLEDLIETVIREGTTQVNTHVRAVLDALPPDVDPLERITLAVEAHLQVTLGMSDYAIAAVRNSRQLPDSMRSSIHTTEEEYGLLWRNLVETAHDAGSIRQDADPYLTRMLILGALNWAVEWWRPDLLPAQTVIETAQGMVRRGLEARRALPTSPLFIEPQF